MRIPIWTDQFAWFLCFIGERHEADFEEGNSVSPQNFSRNDFWRLLFIRLAYQRQNAARSRNGQHQKIQDA
jgi:hypothetical protein